MEEDIHQVIAENIRLPRPKIEGEGEVDDTSRPEKILSFEKTGEIPDGSVLLDQLDAVEDELVSVDVSVDDESGEGDDEKMKRPVAQNRLPRFRASFF